VLGVEAIADIARSQDAEAPAKGGVRRRVAERGHGVHERRSSTPSRPRSLARVSRLVAV
jgi:hypothetical protein